MRMSFDFDDMEVKDIEIQYGLDDGGMDIFLFVDFRENEDSEIFMVLGELFLLYDEVMNLIVMVLNGVGYSISDDFENMDIFLEFLIINLYELEDRVFVDNWLIFYKREELLGKCLLSVVRFVQEGLFWGWVLYIIVEVVNVMYFSFCFFDFWVIFVCNLVMILL